MFQSRSTRSTGPPAWSMASASWPLAASSTVKPSSRSSLLTIARIERESSTTRAFMTSSPPEIGAASRQPAFRIGSPPAGPSAGASTPRCARPERTAAIASIVAGAAVATWAPASPVVSSVE